MKKIPVEPTTAENLEEKFDRGEDVLDYFEMRKARVIKPPKKSSMAKAKSPYGVKQNSDRRAVVREKPAHYRAKK